MTWLLVAWRFVKKWWWLFLALLGAVAVVMWRILGASDAYPRPDGGDPDRPPPRPRLKERAQQEVERVRLEAEVEKTKVVMKSEAQLAEVKAIEDVGKTDPKEGRRRLAEFLAKNL